MHLAFITMVFHRILDFKTGLHFYAGPFYFIGRLQQRCEMFTAYLHIVFSILFGNLSRHKVILPWITKQKKKRMLKILQRQKC